MRKTASDTPSFFSTPRGLILLCLGVATVLFLEGRAFLVAPMPSGAYPVLSTTAWAMQGPQTAYGLPYHWMANGDVAFLRKNSNGRFQVCYQQMDAKGPVGLLRIGPELPTNSQAGLFLPSPDERWIAISLADNKNRYRNVLLSADGQTTRTIGDANETFRGWLSDSRSFLSLCFRPTVGLKIRHLDSTHTEMILGATPTDIPEPMFGFASGREFQVGSFYNFTQANSRAPRAGTQMTMRSFDVSKPGSASKTSQVTVPPNCEYAGGYVSPDQKHILWIASIRKSYAGSSWINNLVATRAAGVVYETRCYISDLNGNNRHPILEDVLSHFAGIEPAWTPDGKHVSFIFQNQLYLVPVGEK